MDDAEDSGEVECRYQRTRDAYVLKMWGEGKESTHSGDVADQPEWLGRILVLGRVGGHVLNVAPPPPNEILWFVLDADGDLKRFLTTWGAK
jgi:hypothetical protein